MASLYLLRHAKSDWHTGLPDHDRPLNSRGQSAAQAMGRWLAQEGIWPPLVICSTAQRARETLENLLLAKDLSPDILYEPALYGAGAETIMRIVEADAGHLGSVLLIGHNPGFHDFANRAAKVGVPEILRKLRRKYPTCTLSGFDFDSATLGQSDMEAGTLTQFVRPKDIE